MDFRCALNEVLDHYDIQAKDLAESSDVSPESISRFRNGRKDMRTDSFQRLLDALPTSARMYFWFLVLSDAVPIEQVKPTLGWRPGP